MQVERVGKWSIAKLDVLEAYLKPYADIMNAQKQPRADRKAWLRAFYYIDAFAGPGAVAMRDDDAVDSEADGYLDGSPARALACRPKFDRLWFIDKRQSRKHSLEELLSERRESGRAQIAIGDCNKLLGAIVKRMEWNERALAFLDPYGLQLDWATVEALALTEKLDVFINFSLMGVLRNLPRSGSPPQTVRETLDRVMASGEWVDALYTSRMDLFGDVLSGREQIAAGHLAALYATDLETVFPCVSDPIIMTNSREGPIYALILASHKPAAAKIMNDIGAKYAMRAAAARARSRKRAGRPGNQTAFDI